MEKIKNAKQGLRVTNQGGAGRKSRWTLYSALVHGYQRGSEGKVLHAGNERDIRSINAAAQTSARESTVIKLGL